MISPILNRYLEDGYVHLTNVFKDEEVELAIKALRHLPDWIRRRSGDRNIQRVQPLQTCPALGDPAWIRRFFDNTELDRILAELFGGSIDPVPRMSRDLQLTGLLIEPLDNWWSTGLHRDYRDFLEGLDVPAWKARTEDLRLFNQVNIPLLPDSSFWLIPGSQQRDDLEAEARLVASRSRYADCRTKPDGQGRIVALRRELTEELKRCGALNLDTGPGDLVIYRSCMLHCGLYDTTAKRLTLHDAVYSSEWYRFVLETLRRPGPGSVMRTGVAASGSRNAPSGTLGQGDSPS